MLCPGYTHVPEFGPNDLYEDDGDDEEVMYVTLDLGSIEPTLVPSSSTYRLIGLDTPTPFLQLSGTILKGKHEKLLGSEILFKDSANPTKKTLTPLDPPTTSTRICFQEVRLTPIDPFAPPPPSIFDISNDPSLDTSQDTSSFDTSAIDPALLPSPGPASISSRSSKRKSKPKDPADEGLVASSEAASQLLDRVTGKNVSRVRAPRKSATASATPVPSSPVPAVETARPRRTRKGKAKATDDNAAHDLDDIGVPMDVDEDGDGDSDEYAP